MKSLSVFTN